MTDPGFGGKPKLWIACVAVVILLSLSAQAIALLAIENGEPWIKWPNNKRTLKVYVPPGESQAFKDAAEAARDSWNDANTGWTFEATTDASEADVTLHTGSLDDPLTGEASETESTAPGNPTTGMDVTMDDDGGGQGWGGSGDPDTQNLATAIAHELGHCIGLDDVPESGHTMTSPRGPDDDDHGISTGDWLEAWLASWGMDIWTWLLWLLSQQTYVERGGSTFTWVMASPGSEPMMLEQAINVEFEALNFEHLDAFVVGWDPEFVWLEFFASPDADEMEGYMLHIMYPDRGIVTYRGFMRTGDLPNPGLLPYAIAPEHVYQDAGLPAFIDASGSYHDDPAAVLCYHWKAYRADGTLFCTTWGMDPCADFWLPSGDTTVELRIHDQWGNESTAYTQVHVAPRSSPVDTFDVGWNYFSIPLPAQDPTPDTVLGFSCKGKLWRWDTYFKAMEAYNPPFVSFDIYQGDAFLLLLTDPIDITYESDAFYWLWEKRLGKQGWAWVGFPAVDELALGGDDFMNSVKVQYPLQSGIVRSAAEDRGSPDPWISWGWPYWDPHMQAFRTFTPYSPFGDNVCRPWLGYYVYANIGTATMPDDADQVTLCWPSMP